MDDEHPRWPVPWEAAVMLGLSLLLTVLAWSLLTRQVEQTAGSRFRALARDLDETLVARLNSYEQILRGTVAFMNARDTVTRGEWRTYVDSLRVERHYPGIQGIGFAERVTPDALERHADAVRSEGFPSYQVTPPGPRDVYFPIVYLEPFSGRNLRAFGYDMYAEPVRRAAMARARDEGRAIATGKVTLVQETDVDVQAGFLIYLPVYRDAAIPSGVTARRGTLRGFVYSPFRVGNLMEAVQTGRFRDYLDVRIYDGAAANAQTMLYDSPAVPDGHHRTVTTVTIFGRAWTVDIASTATFEASTQKHTPLVALGAGLIISVLIGVVTRSLLTGRQQAAALVRSHAAINLARAEAEEANAAKSRFLAAASHDLRQPLQTLGIYLHLIAGDDGTPARPRLLDAARDAFEATQRMLNAIMDIAALESGVARPQTRTVDLPAFLARLAEEVRPETEAKGLTLRVALRPGTVDTDPTMLERIVRNLLHNALKYTHGGAILLACRPSPRGVVIKVQDTGPGIPADRLPLIFEDFYQVDNPERDRGKGLGLGLAIVARLTRLLGYRVRVLSRVGRGTVFLVELPDARTAADAG